MTAEALKAIPSRESDGSAETRIHPGFMRAAFPEPEPIIGRSSVNARREQELEALLDPILKEAVRDLDVRPINFSDL